MTAPITAGRRLKLPYRASPIYLYVVLAGAQLSARRMDAGAVDVVADEDLHVVDVGVAAGT
jgi:hypothetical protein